jgi:hypothetical protein
MQISKIAKKVTVRRDGPHKMTYVVQQLRLALSNGTNSVDVSPHLGTETDPVSEMLCSLVFEYRQWTQSFTFLQFAFCLSPNHHNICKY